jgi:hypothetical protein
MNIRNFFFSKQTEAVLETEAPAEPVIVREDFTISNFDQMPVDRLLMTLRDRTCDFALDNGLTTATTEFNYIDELPLIVELTENYDILYTVNRFKTFSFQEAVAIIEDIIQF